jgi:hypothetical protein
MATLARVRTWVSKSRLHLYFLLLMPVMDSESRALIRVVLKLTDRSVPLLDVEQAIKGAF